MTSRVNFHRGQNLMLNLRLFLQNEGKYRPSSTQELKIK